MKFAGAGGDSIDALLVRPPDSGAAGDGSATESAHGILLIHEVFGLDAHMRDVAERFAAAGHVVLAPDLYSRAGVPGPESTEADPAPRWEVEAIRAAAMGLPDRRALADLDAAAAHLAALPGVADDCIAAVGFCMGGNLAFQLGCTSTRLAAIVDFYGRPLYAELSANKPIQPVELTLNLDRPLLAFFGGRDASIPATEVELLREALEAGAKNFELVIYPEADHSFFNDLRHRYDEASARDAWQRTLAFLHEVL